MSTQAAEKWNEAKDARQAEREGTRRLRAQDVIEAQQRIIEQLTTRSGEPYVSVEFTRNAKGETQISTKVSAPGNVDADELNRITNAAMNEARAAYESACAKFPTGTGSHATKDRSRRRDHP